MNASLLWWWDLPPPPTALKYDSNYTSMSALHTTNFWVNKTKIETGEVERMGLAVGSEHESVEWGTKIVLWSNWLIIEIMNGIGTYLMWWRTCALVYIVLDYG